MAKQQSALNPGQLAGAGFDGRTWLAHFFANNAHFGRGFDSNPDSFSPDIDNRQSNLRA
jgi:hypothetical protein